MISFYIYGSMVHTFINVFKTKKYNEVNINLREEKCLR